ncbi:bifunctional oligoribonuclease/PAP phosphatase NrnA [Mycoplasmatota bacterium]|nr:bifunctional oligoribonuclease/PAP phosphatase NrnA [Mycoplasmatota bacterium]
MDFIFDKIKSYDTIIIHRHIRPDGDCIGSQLGLKNIIEQTFPEKKVYAVGEESLGFIHLGKMDHIRDELYQNALVFILDVANIERISDNRYRKGKECIKIDHHPKRETICELEWIDPSYASCCEMIVDFYEQNKSELKLSIDGAKALYFGIITDTNRFSTPAVNSRTMRLASGLLEYNLNISEIYQWIYDEALNITRLRGFVASNFICTRNGLGYINIDKKICNQYLVDANISNVLVNTLANTALVKIWFVAIFDAKTNYIRISLRSKSLPINQFAEKYGGGGHKNASGIIVKDFYIVNQLISDLDIYLKENA